MSTFLELCQEARRLSGIQGSGPTDVATATGIELDIVNYVKNAWTDIQAHPKNWKWMRREYLPVGGNPLQTIATVDEYVLTNVMRLRTNTFRTYLTATGVSDRQWINFITWNEFRRSYEMTAPPAANRPLIVTQKPTGELKLWPAPNDVYSIEFEYYRLPTLFSANDDDPFADDGFPEMFHQLIVYEALKRFGNGEDAQEVLQLAEAAAGSDGNENRPVSGLWRALIWDQEVRDIEDQRDRELMVVVAD